MLWHNTAVPGSSGALSSSTVPSVALASIAGAFRSSPTMRARADVLSVHSLPDDLLGHVLALAGRQEG